MDRKKLSLAATAVMSLSFAWLGVSYRHTLAAKYHVVQYRNGHNREHAALAIREAFTNGALQGEELIELLHDSDPGSMGFSYILLGLEGNPNYVFDSIEFRIKQAEHGEWQHPLSMVGLTLKDRDLSVHTQEQETVLHRLFESCARFIEFEPLILPEPMMCLFASARYLGVEEQQEALKWYNAFHAKDGFPWVFVPHVVYLKGDAPQVKASSFAEGYAQVKLSVDDPQKYFQVIR